MTDTPALPDPPADPLMQFVINMIVPLLMSAGIADVDLARLAAIQAIDSYRAHGETELLRIAEIASFAIASVDSLRLSMAEDVPVELKLKLRGSARTLSQTSKQATTALPRQGSPRPPAMETPAVAPDDAPSEADMLASLAEAKAAVQQAQVAPATPNGQAERQRKLVWANAMNEVAAECSAELDKLTPAQRREKLIWFGALTETARVLADDKAPPPSDLAGYISARRSRR